MNKENMNKIKEYLKNEGDNDVTIYHNDNNINYSVENSNKQSYRQNFRIIYPLIRDDKLLVETDLFEQCNVDSLRKYGTYDFGNGLVEYKIDKTKQFVTPNNNIIHYINMKQFLITSKNMHLIQHEGILGNISMTGNKELTICNKDQIRNSYKELVKLYNQIKKGDLSAYNLLSLKIKEFEKYLTSLSDDYDYVASKVYKKI